MAQTFSLNTLFKAFFSLGGTKITPGTRGSKPSQYLGCPVTDKAPKVLP